MLVTWKKSAVIVKITRSFLMMHAMGIKKTPGSTQKDINAVIIVR